MYSNLEYSKVNNINHNTSEKPLYSKFIEETFNLGCVVGVDPPPLKLRRTGEMCQDYTAGAQRLRETETKSACDAWLEAI